MQSKVPPIGRGFVNLSAWICMPPKGDEKSDSEGLAGGPAADEGGRSTFSTETYRPRPR
jgi:hypothetical protein